MTTNQLLKSKLFLLLLLVLVFGVGASVISELRQHYTIEEEITTLEQQIISLEQNNTELAGLAEYFESSEYQEQEARRQLNLQRPGEHVVVVPETSGSVPEQPVVEAHPVDPNWRLWWDYFFGV